MGPVNKDSSNDRQAEELGNQFNVSYTHWGVTTISTVKKTTIFISFENKQYYSLLSSEVLSTVSVKILVS
jgi:aromatic ring-cleaving dioxygenase